MKYIAYKLCFQTSVHFGDGMLNDTKNTFCADTLFSAFCIEALKFGEKNLQNVYEKFNSGKLKISDGFPFIDNDLYIPKPLYTVESPESDTKDRKKWKKLKYLSLEKLDDYFAGKLNVEKENDRLSKLGEFEVRQSVNLRNEEKTDPFSIGIYHFNNKLDCGLYFILGYEDEDDRYMLENLIDSLGFQGIGGKTSSGLGKFSMLPQTLSESVVGKLEDTAPDYILLTTSLPKDSEIEKVLEGSNYLLEKRSGYISSNNYAEELVKKQDIYFLKAGSYMKKRFDGDIYNVGGQGTHPVWRYAKPIMLGV